MSNEQWAADHMEKIIDRAWADVQMNQAVNETEALTTEELKQAFLLGCYHAINVCIEYFDEQEWFEQHIGEEYDYLYDDER